MPATDDSATRWMALACAVAGAALAFAMRPAGATHEDAVMTAAVAHPPAAARYADQTPRPRVRPVRAHPRPAVHPAPVHPRPAASPEHARPVRSEPSRALVAQGSRACPPGDDRTRSVSIDDGRGTRRVEWADASCEVEVVIEGDVRFNEDFTDFAAITPGGGVRISERGGGVDRLLEIRPGSGGALSYSWRVSGRELPFDVEARAWLRGFVPELLRTSGIAAEERVAWLVRTEGPEGLLREIPLMRSDRAQRLYLEAWLGAGPHDPPDVARALEVAGAQLKSDRELAAVLLRVIDAGPVEGSLRDEFMSALGTIESDREYGRVASALLRGTGG